MQTNDKKYKEYTLKYLEHFSHFSTDTNTQKQFLKYKIGDMKISYPSHLTDIGQCEIFIDELRFQIDLKTGGLVEYFNYKRQNQRYKKQIDYKKRYLINNQNEAKEWVSKNITFFHLPNVDLKSVIRFSHHATIEDSNPIMICTWEMNAPYEQKYRWKYDINNNKVYINPYGRYEIDPLDGTILYARQYWDYHFEKPDIRISQTDAIQKAKQYYRQVIEKKNLTLETCHEAELCYASVNSYGFRIKNGVIIPPYGFGDNLKKPGGDPRQFPRKMYLVWCVRFGIRKEEEPSIEEVWIHSKTGELIQMNVFSSKKRSRVTHVLTDAEIKRAVQRMKEEEAKKSSGR
jgi:hypothetical protein